MPDPAHNDASLRWRWLLPVIGLVALFNLTPFDTTLNRAFFDQASRYSFREPVLPPDSAIVLIDDHAMSAMSAQGVRWPFPRMIFAQMILALHLAGAEHIAVDLTFFEESNAAEQDLLLGSLTAAMPTVVLARTAEKPPVFWSPEFVAAHNRFFQVPRAGRVEFPDDDDGVARRYGVADSLAAVTAGFTGQASGDLLRWHAGLHFTSPAKQSRLADKGVPVLSAKQFIDAGRPVLERLLEAAPDMDPDTFAAALAKEPRLQGATADIVRGRTVFLGASASGTFDVKPVPIGKVEPGVLIHWTAWANLKLNQLIHSLGWPWVVGVSLLVGLITQFVGINRTSVALPLLTATLMVILVLACAWAGLSFGWFLPPATPLATVLFVLLGVVMENFWREQRRKREIQGMFGAYVDPAVVEKLVRDPVSIRLGGERREATVFFSDLAGFTDLSEKLKDRPERMVEIVNAYLEETSECLHRHGAYVDKYIGDAVMAVLGAPSPLANHALSACLAALEAREAMVGINQRYAADLGLKLEVRIGLNTGEMIVGNLGSSRKKNYTVMGDAVNLGSRLEGANKAFGTGILIGEETAKRVQGAVLTRPLTRLKVKGKKEAVEVHTVHGEPGKLSDSEKEFVATYRAGYTAYVERRFADALPALTRALALRPDDLTTRRLHADVTAFSSQPPPPDWEPVLSLDSK